MLKDRKRKTFQTFSQVQVYLYSCGYKIGKSKFYKDQSEGLVSRTSAGVYSEDGILSYIRKSNLDKKDPHGNFKIISNKRYGRLTVLRPIQKRGKHYKTYYLCCCDCGTKKIVARSSLINGHTRSCGCLRKEVLKKRTGRRTPRKNLKGKRFGRLIAIGRKFMNNKYYWFCKCDCGKNKFVSHGSLMSGFTRSCGCLNAERASEFMTKFNLSDRAKYAQALANLCSNSSLLKEDIPEELIEIQVLRMKIKKEVEKS